MVIGDEIPKAHVCVVRIPSEDKMSKEQFIDRLDKQNEGINTDEWKILRVDTESNGGQIFTFMVDEASAAEIMKRKNQLFLLLSRVEVRIRGQKQQTRADHDPKAGNKNDRKSEQDHRGEQKHRRRSDEPPRSDRRKDEASLSPRKKSARTGEERRRVHEPYCGPEHSKRSGDRRGEAGPSHLVNRVDSIREEERRKSESRREGRESSTATSSRDTRTTERSCERRSHSRR